MDRRISLALTALFALGTLGDTALGTSVDYEDYAGFVDQYNFAPPRKAPTHRGDPEEYDMASKGDLVFIAFGPDGMDIYDDPGNTLSEFTGTSVYSVTVTDDPNCIWIGAVGQVHRMDVSDPENPVVVETIVIAGSTDPVDNLSIDGDTLLAQTVNGAYRIRLTGPCGSSIGSDLIPNSSNTTVASDFYQGIGALVGTGTLLVANMNVDPPTSVLRTIPGGDIRDVTVLNNSEVVITTGSGLKRYGAPTPGDIDQNTSLQNVRHIRRGPDESLIVTDDSNRLHLVSNMLQRRASLAAPSDAASLSVDDGKIYVRRSGMQTTAGISKYRYGNGMSPNTLQVIQDDVFVPVGLAMDDDYVVISDNGGMTGGRSIVYTRVNKDVLVRKGEVDLFSAAQTIRVFQPNPRRSSQHARGTASWAVMGSLAEFAIVDYTDAGNPVVLGSIPGSSSEVGASPDGALVVRSSSSPLGFYAVDVTDPSTPTDQGFVSTPNAVNNMLVDGSFVVAATTGLTGRWNFSDPNTPVLDHATSLTGIRSVAASGTADQYYLGSTGSGKRVVRYDFATQSELSEVSVGAGVLSVVGTGGGALLGGGEIVYAGDNIGTLFVIDWTDPMDPILVGEYTEPGLVIRGVAATDETVTLTNGSFPGNVLVLPAHTASVTTTTPDGIQPITLLFDKSWPNPFTASTTLRFTLDRRSDVRMEVFDVQGRRVRTLTSATLPAGRHTVEWDGRDGGGRGLSSGTYFVRITAGDRTDHLKVRLMR